MSCWGLQLVVAPVLIAVLSNSKYHWRSLSLLRIKTNFFRIWMTALSIVTSLSSLSLSALHTSCPFPSREHNAYLLISKVLSVPKSLSYCLPFYHAFLFFLLLFSSDFSSSVDYLSNFLVLLPIFTCSGWIPVFSLPVPRYRMSPQSGLHEQLDP